jgi:hypothetical protein
LSFNKPFGADLVLQRPMLFNPILKASQDAADAGSTARR